MDEKQEKVQYQSPEKEWAPPLPPEVDPGAYIEKQGGTPYMTIPYGGMKVPLRTRRLKDVLAEQKSEKK